MNTLHKAVLRIQNDLFRDPIYCIMSFRIRSHPTFRITPHYNLDTVKKNLSSIYIIRYQHSLKLSHEVWYVEIRLRQICPQLSLKLKTSKNRIVQNLLWIRNEIFRIQILPFISRRIHNTDKGYVR